MKTAREEGAVTGDLTAREIGHSLIKECPASNAAGHHSHRCNYATAAIEYAEARGFQVGQEAMREAAANLIGEALDPPNAVSHGLQAAIRDLPVVPK